jgi:hypothetical protein
MTSPGLRRAEASAWRSRDRDETVAEHAKSGAARLMVESRAAPRTRLAQK